MNHKRIRTSSCNGWGALRTAALILVLCLGPFSLAEPEEEGTLEPGELSRFLLHLDPSRQGAEEFFARLHTDAEFRKSVAAQIEKEASGPVKSAAEAGNLFRSEYRRWLGESFSEAPLAPYAENPRARVRESFEAFLRAQRGIEEKRLPEFLVKEMARAFAAKKNSVDPATPIEDFQEPGTQLSRDFNRGRLYFEDEKEPRRQNKPYAAAQRLQLWKAHLGKELSQARVHNLMGALQLVGQIHPNAKLRLSPVVEANGKWTRSALPGKTVKLTPLLSGHTVHFVQSPNPNSVQWVEPKRWFGSTLPLAKGARGYLQFTPLEGKGPAFTVPVEAILSATDYYQERVVHGDNPNQTKRAMRFLEETVDREKEMHTAKTFLEAAPTEDSKQFAQRLAKKEVDTLGTRAGSHSLTRRVADHGTGDWGEGRGETLLQGLEWYGLLQGGDHWWKRDRAAEKKERPHWEESGKRGMSAWLAHRARAMKDTVAQTGHSFADHFRHDHFTRKVLPLVLLAIPVIGVGGFKTLDYFEDDIRPAVESAKDWVDQKLGLRDSQEGKEDGAHSSEAPPSEDAEARDGSGEKSKGFRMQKPSLATNGGGENQGPGKGDVLWQITQKREGAKVPMHFDVPWPENTELESGTQKRQVYHRNKDFLIQSHGPQYADDRGVIAIPRPHGSEVLRVTLYRGNFGPMEQDFDIMEDKASGMYYLKLRGSSSGDFSFTASYENVPEEPSAQFRSRLPLDAETVHREVKRLRNAGFVLIADAIEERQNRATRENRSLDPSQIAEAINGESYYTYQQEPKPGPERDGNPYTKWSHFLKDGRMCAQCDGSNQLLDAFLGEAYRDQPDIEVENRWTFVRKFGDEFVSSGGSHLRTEVQREGEQITYDATPRQRDPSDPVVNEDAGPKPELDPPVEELNGDPEPDKEKENQRPEWIGIMERRRPPKLVEERLPTVGSGEHDARIEALNRLRKALIDNPFFRNIPKTHRTRDLVPPVRALRLAMEVHDFSSGSTDWGEFLEATENLFPRLDFTQYEDSSKLGDLVRDAVNLNNTHWEEALPKLRQARNTPYGYLENELLKSAVAELTDFLTQTDWTPVRYKDVPAEAVICSRALQSLAGN